MLGIFFSAKSAVLIEDVPFTEEDIRGEWVDVVAVANADMRKLKNTNIFIYRPTNTHFPVVTKIQIRGRISELNSIKLHGEFNYLQGQKCLIILVSFRADESTGWCSDHCCIKISADPSAVRRVLKKNISIFLGCIWYTILILTPWNLLKITSETSDWETKSNITIYWPNTSILIIRPYCRQFTLFTSLIDCPRAAAFRSTLLYLHTQNKTKYCFHQLHYVSVFQP